MTVLGTRFRLGATSYVWPDGLLPNVRSLGPWVDDVELVLFEVDNYSNLPDAGAVLELNDLAEEHDLTYTVHLPADLSLANHSSLAKAEKVIASTLDLAPWAYVLHLDGRSVEGNVDPVALGAWQEDAGRVVDEVSAMCGTAQRLCVENLENYAPEHYLPLLEQSPANLCIDVGHLWLTGRDPLPFLESHLSRTRVIHLHGIDRWDHQSLVHAGCQQVTPILDLLSAHAYEGVVTLEVFGQEDFFPSRSLIAGIVNGHR